MKKKILVHGTADSLQKFFSDAVAEDFNIVAVLSDTPEEISVEDDGRPVEVFSPENLPKFVLNLVDGIIFTAANQNSDAAKFFLKLGIEPRKIILWDAAEGWGTLNLPDADGTPVAYFCGLEFHIGNEDDKNFFDWAQSWLQNQWQVKNLGAKLYPEILAESFQWRVGRPLDLDNPKTFTEKIQWLKIFGSTPIKSQLADKFSVRGWVADKIGDEYLIPLLGVWNDFDDIDFDALPEKFVLKCNHGSAMNIVVRDKKNFDVRRAREKFNAWLAIDFATGFFELHYTRIKRKIIAEKFLTNGDAPDINDYKFWCFGGRVEYVQVDRNRSTNHVQRFYTVDWEPLDFIILGHKLDTTISEKPPTLKKMLEIAEKLSDGFSIVRVDLYCVENKIYFGEMTFTPLAGYIKWTPAEMDYRIGKLIQLDSGK